MTKKVAKKRAKARSSKRASLTNSRPRPPSSRPRKKPGLTARSRRSRKIKPNGASLWLVIFRPLLWLGFFALLALTLWMWQLDQKVQAGFNAPFKGIPGHLYARPYSLQIGDKTSREKIETTLVSLGYHHVKQINKAGDFALSGPLIDIYRQTNRIHPERLAVRVVLSHGRVEQLTDHTNGQPLERLEFASRLIGNLITGPMEDRLLLKLHDIPPLLLDALITMEDRRFAVHHGIDPMGILRALIQNFRAGRISQGGSTLTQQLVKNLYLDNARTLRRKIKEALMALIIEWRYDKSQILTRYINTIFLGQSGNRAIHGFGLAAQFYYNRKLSNLRPAQIAMLVGMIPAPSAYNPFRNNKRARARRNLVLDTLQKNGFITMNEASLYKLTALNVVRAQSNRTDRFGAFTDLLNRQLDDRYNSVYSQTSGINVFSTLDENIQISAQKNLRFALGKLEEKHGITRGSLQAAMIIIEKKTGEIVALVGDRKGKTGNFNRALDANRPIGSLVKPAIYLTALLNPERYSSASLIDDAPFSVTAENGKVWQPGNYDNQYHGQVNLNHALVKSYNIPAVKVGMDIGLEAVATTFQRLGLDAPNTLYPSMLLGASNRSLLQVAQMYQTLSNKGETIPLTTLRFVTNQDNQILARYHNQGEQMINARANFILVNSLYQVVQTGTARALKGLMPEIDLAGKTGTTNDYRDSWFAGFGEKYVAVTWVGKDDNSPTGLTGSSGALRAWAEVMSKVDMHSLDLSPPQGVIPVDVDTSNGLLAVSGCTDVSARHYFIEGYEPISNHACEEVEDELAGWLARWFGGVSDNIKTNESERLSTTQPTSPDKIDPSEER